MPRGLLQDLMQDDWSACGLAMILMAFTAAGPFIFLLIMAIGTVYMVERRGIRNSKQ